MGLIEKAGEALSEGLAPAIETAPQAGAVSAPFDLDYAALVAAGYYAPGARGDRLPLELRAIKRRLLRRLGLKNAAGEHRLARRGGRNRNLVLVTSTRPGEGKSFCAVNLALSLACEEALEVLLVDADSARPKIRATFALPESAGLSDLLREQNRAPEAVCRRARQAPFSVLGEGAPVKRPGELYASTAAQKLFTALSMARPGGVVIIDAPPALATDEAAALARHVDEVIFVVEADATPQAAAAAALDEMLEANPNVSLVLNRCLISGPAAYYGSYEDYGRVRGAAEAPTDRRDEGNEV